MNEAVFDTVVGIALFIVTGYSRCVPSCGAPPSNTTVAFVGLLVATNVTVLFVPSAKTTDGDTDKETDQEIDDRARCTDGSQRLCTDVLSDDDGVYGIIQLLKKCADQNREKEKQNLFPNYTGCNRVFLFSHKNATLSAAHKKAYVTYTLCG